MCNAQNRTALLAAVHEIVNQRLVHGTWGNMSLRTEDGFVLITPSGRDYATMQPDDLILINLTGDIVAGEGKPSSEAPLHVGIYLTCPEVGAILHVHSLYACMFAAAHAAIPVILEETAQVIGHEIITLPYAPCGTVELAQVVCREAAGKRALLLANHGLVALGQNLDDALRIVLIAEKTAQVAIGAASLGKIHSLEPEEIERLRAGYLQYIRQ